MKELESTLAMDVRTGALIALILCATFIAAKILDRAIDRAIARSEKRGEEDTTGLRFVRRCLLVLTYGLGCGWALVQIPELQTMGHSVLAGAGVLTIVAGLASQQVLGNVVSGVLIVIFRPFRLNDRISVNGMTGVVEDINLRDIVLRDPDNNRIVIPNSIITGNAVVNFHHTDTRVRRRIEVGIGYDSDVDTALALLVEIVRANPARIDGRSPAEVARGDAEVIARVSALGESAVVLSTWFWARNIADAAVIEGELLRAIKLRFDADGITIPYPQRTLSFAPGTAARIASPSA
ncbi:MAG: mechanosensitive ion channel family protein [Rhodocyclaceae bacterium]|nr:mechanosensitive ion channel family protein [Rhodocyclaceae bacterium]